MCLFALAHRVSAEFPMVIAANRDEAYDRPTIGAGFWSDAPAVLGGRDALLGGSWLAIDRRGRFAAVTNLRSSSGIIGKVSRGELVRRFVTGDSRPVDYASEVADRAGDYAGFHLVAGIAGGETALLSGVVTQLQPGIHALSNADPGVRWPKVEAAQAEVGRLLATTDQDRLAASLMNFLTSSTGERTADPTKEAFVTGDVYGTRASTVIIVNATGQVLFVEQSFGRGGVRIGGAAEFRLAITSEEG